MKFLLNENSIEIILFIFMLVNIVLNNLIYDIKKPFRNINDNILKAKLKVITLYMLIGIILFIISVIHNEKNIYLLIIFELLNILILIIYNYKKEKYELNYKAKTAYTFLIMFYIIIFSKEAIVIYTNYFSNKPHFIKEILLLLFLNLKIILFSFLIMINSSIFISNIKIIYKNKINKILNKCNNYIIKKNNFLSYNYYFYNKKQSKIVFTIDSIIFFFLFPFYFIINIFILLIAFISKTILYLLIKITYILSLFDNNRIIITKQVSRISIIISLSIVYLIVLSNNNTFSQEITEAYNMITTVLLIPLFYDIIKTKK